MPVLVVGADTSLGETLARRLAERGGEVRLFVSDRGVSERLRPVGAKIAVGDLSDDTHVAGAAAGAHTMVVISAAAHDGRELAFAGPDDVVPRCIAAAAAAGVKRLIVVGGSADSTPPPGIELAVVTGAGNESELADEIIALDDAERLGDV